MLQTIGLLKTLGEQVGENKDILDYQWVTLVD
jgi:hypothetical protein